MMNMTRPSWIMANTLPLVSCRVVSSGSRGLGTESAYHRHFIDTDNYRGGCICNELAKCRHISTAFASLPAVSRLQLGLDLSADSCLGLDLSARDQWLAPGCFKQCWKHGDIYCTLEYCCFYKPA